MSPLPLTSLAALLAAVTAPLLPAQPQEPPQERPPMEAPEDGPKRLEAWPELADDRAAKKEVLRLRKAKTEEMAEQAHAALVELGAGAAPLLIENLGAKTLAAAKGDAAAVRLAAALDEVTGPPHTRLLAAEFQHRSPRVQEWALRRAAAFPDPGTRQAAEAAMEAIAAQREPARPDLPYAAALACASAGSVDGLQVLFERAAGDWGAESTTLRAAVEGIRGDEATRLLLVSLKDKDRTRRVAALRLLAGCGSKLALDGLGDPLQSSDNSIRVAAINACRGIVDGEPPLERLSAFQAVEMAKTWQQRLGL